MTTGRSVDELLRLVAALKTSEEHGVSTPEGWTPGDAVIVPPPLTFSGEGSAEGEAAGWYFRTGPLAAVGGGGA